ncbi:MAG: hypothetical protein KIS86_02660 [Devosia sp.]|nr:hypothetical protein [Devosia sp.]
MKTKYPTAPLHTERLDIVLPAHLKHQLFETAAQRGMSASLVVREALAAFVDNQRAA